MRYDELAPPRGGQPIWAYQLDQSPAALLPMTSKLTGEQRRALALLASSRGGCPQELLVARGFTARIIAGLVQDGYASVQRRYTVGGMRVIDVPRIRITAAGRLALQS